jgi:hypothetical protein
MLIRWNSSNPAILQKRKVDGPDPKPLLSFSKIGEDELPGRPALIQTDIHVGRRYRKTRPASAGWKSKKDEKDH